MGRHLEWWPEYRSEPWRRMTPTCRPGSGSGVFWPSNWPQTRPLIWPPIHPLLNPEGSFDKQGVDHFDSVRHAVNAVDVPLPRTSRTFNDPQWLAPPLGVFLFPPLDYACPCPAASRAANFPVPAGGLLKTGDNVTLRRQAHEGQVSS